MPEVRRLSNLFSVKRKKLPFRQFLFYSFSRKAQGGDKQTASFFPRGYFYLAASRIVFIQLLNMRQCPAVVGCTLSQTQYFGSGAES